MMDEINTMFGTHFHIAPMDDVKGLPVYMTLKRTFTKVQDGDSVFVLISVSDQGRFGVVALDKQRILYEDMVVRLHIGLLMLQSCRERH